MQKNEYTFEFIRQIKRHKNIYKVCFKKDIKTTTYNTITTVLYVNYTCIPNNTLGKDR